MKLGIVMEGGASRTIFSCGVTDVFMDENIYPDYLIGVSAGIAYGVSYASKQRGRNEEFTRKYMNDPRYMGMRYLLDPKNAATTIWPLPLVRCPISWCPMTMTRWPIIRDRWWRWSPTSVPERRSILRSRPMKNTGRLPSPAVPCRYCSHR